MLEGIKIVIEIVAEREIQKSVDWKDIKLLHILSLKNNSKGLHIKSGKFNIMKGISQLFILIYLKLVIIWMKQIVDQSKEKFSIQYTILV